MPVVVSPKDQRKNARFGKIEAHEAINAVAREILLVAKEIAENNGFTLLHALVDSLYVWKEGATREDFERLSREIEDKTRLPLAIEGEKGIMILAPIVRRKNESAEHKDTDESSTAVGFRAACVFDISQTDGQELPAIGSVNGDPCECRERLGKFIVEQDISLEYSQDIAPARGTSTGGKITLLPGQSPAEEFATLAHEVAHEMMHGDERRKSTSKRIRETKAEAVAFAVCHAIGLETGSASQDYIQLYEGDAKLLTDSLAHIQKAAIQILNTIGAEATSAPIVVID